MHDIIIVGSGPAGWTAAIYAARADRKPLVFEGIETGGQLMTTTEVENYPGFPKGILGPELMPLFREQAKRFGAEIRSELVERIHPTEDGFEVTAKGEIYKAKTVILAMGATARRLGLPAEKALYGHGVSACATCDGFFFKGKNVVVVGGGDSAMEEAQFLTRFASQVTIVHRRNEFRASKIMQERALANPKIRVIWDSEVADILGVEVGHVTGVRLRNVKTGETSEISMDGVFAAIGHEPNSLLVADLVDLDEKKYVKTIPGTTKTKVPGLFACGDLQDPWYRQAVTAAGTGCMAAIDADHYLAE
ncbi:thioredoxin-disulfide reductase [Candidatus Uhrbacteria bacterium]|nr:thioredoxin-disulfide reductase [Candidatus Uhrbacteria bacterium]